MGFTEMPTNNYVESSFWNFDALFQPQQHPARDAHDTFFLTKPAVTDSSTVPQDYLKRVQETHECGGYGSIGYASTESWRVLWSTTFTAIDLLWRTVRRSTELPSLV
jgi:phenylalanyl-tRNA synthetase alpha chain